MSFLIVATGWGARLVLLLLVGLSLWSVAIMVEKYKSLKALGGSADLEEAKRLIRQKDAGRLGEWAGTRSTLAAGALVTALEMRNAAPALIDRSVKSFLMERRNQLEKGLGVLATLGSNAPFIGLFGTVLGIIQAFGVLANSPSGTASVMASLAEALVATAVGLFVAIPAVVAYNVFSRQLKVALNDCEILRDFYVAHMSPGKAE